MLKSDILKYMKQFNIFRVQYYPTGMPLYSCSRGMKRPTVERITNKDIKNKLKNYYLSFRQSFVIGDKEKGNIVDKRYYQKKGTGSSRFWRKTNKAVVPDELVKPIDPLWKIKLSFGKHPFIFVVFRKTVV